MVIGIGGEFVGNALAVCAATELIGTRDSIFYARLLRQDIHGTYLI